jgi:hypothetical protein
VSTASVAFGAESLEREGASAGLLAGAAAVSIFAAWVIPGNRLGLGAVLVAGGIAGLVMSNRAQRCARRNGSSPWMVSRLPGWARWP